jgi:hypothetical protein
MFLMLMVLIQIIFCPAIYVFLKTSWIGLVEQWASITTLENLHCRKYSFQKLTPLSQWNNTQDAAASNIQGFLSRGTVFLWLTWIGYWIKMNLLCLKNFDLTRKSLEKHTHFSHGNNVLHSLAPNTDGFLLRDSYYSKTQLNSPIWSKESIATL